MMSEHAKDRVNKVIGTIHAVLNRADLMGDATFGRHPATWAVDQIVTVPVVNCSYFSVHFEEIRCNTNRGLANLVKVRLAQTLYDMAEYVDAIPLLKTATPPLELVQGL